MINTIFAHFPPVRLAGVQEVVCKWLADISVFLQAKQQQKGGWPSSLHHLTHITKLSFYPVPEVHLNHEEYFKN